MAVAVKSSPETTGRTRLNSLAVGSLAGTAYVLTALAIIFSLLPMFWGQWVTPLFSGAAAVSQVLLLLLLAVVALGLGFLGVRLLGPNPPQGIRAGIAGGMLVVFIVGFLTRWIGAILENISYNTGWFGPGPGLVVMAVAGAALLFLGIRLMFKPGFSQWAVIAEQQGWFSLAAYKRSQGQRVRRGTIVGILAVFGSGIYTLLSHGTLETGPNDYSWSIPMTGRVEVKDAGDAALLGGVTVNVGTILSRYELRDLNARFPNSESVRISDPGGSSFRKGEIVTRKEFEDQRNRMEEVQKKKPALEPLKPVAGTTTYLQILLLPHIRFTLPVLLAAAGLWLGYRLVNFPRFADFLIATEAELNKVSWVSRRRLVQDTVVVLTTMFVITIFLFMIDVAWVWILGNKWIAIVPNPDEAQKRMVQDLDW